MSFFTVIPLALVAAAWKISRLLEKGGTHFSGTSPLWQKLEFFSATVVALSHVEIAWRYRSSSEWTASPTLWWLHIAQSAMVLWIMLHGMRAVQIATQPLHSPLASVCRTYLAAALRFAATYWLLTAALYLALGLGLAPGVNPPATAASTLPAALHLLIPGLAETRAGLDTQTLGLMTAYSLWPIPVVAAGYLLAPGIWAIRKPSRVLVALAAPCLIAAIFFIKSSPGLAFFILGLGALLGFTSGLNAHAQESRHKYWGAGCLFIFTTLLFFQKEIYTPASITIIWCITGTAFLLRAENNIQNQKIKKLPNGIKIIIFHGILIFTFITNYKFFNI